MSASTEKKRRQAARETGTDRKQQAAERLAAEKAKSRFKWTLGTVLVVLLIVAILFLNSNVLFKSTTALTIGDTSYSPAEVNYRYASQFYNWANTYGSYAAMFGLDTSKGLAGLANQEYPDGGTWADFFKEEAVTAMIQTKAITDYAKAEGIELSAEEEADIEAEFAELDAIAQQQGYASVANLLAMNYGTGVNEDVAFEAGRESVLASKAVSAYIDTLEYSAEELEEKYQSYNGDNDYFDVVYYYVAAELVEAEDGSKAANEETLAAARVTAEEILAAYEALGVTEDEEGNEVAVEGLDVEQRLNDAIAQCGVEGTAIRTAKVTGSSLGAYQEWAKAERSEGDATVVDNSNGNGCYVVAFISRDDNHYPLAQVRHILVMAEADAEGVYTDEAKAAALARAEEIYAEWQNGEATEESFAALAEQYSEDGGSNTNGGLYDNVMKGQMVEEFDEFCFAGHESGDTGIVYGEAMGGYAGYHVMYYVGEGQLASDYIAENDLINTASQEWLDSLVEGYEAEKGFFFKLVG